MTTQKEPGPPDKISVSIVRWHDCTLLLVTMRRRRDNMVRRREGRQSKRRIGRGEAGRRANKEEITCNGNDEGREVERGEETYHVTHRYQLSGPRRRDWWG